jgi:phosphopantothenoylcysteine synthetase/decarboxylase
MLVAPASSNTIAKWALGISDNLALGLITEAIGLRLPLAALAHLNPAQAAHPAFAGHLDTLRAASVTVLVGEDAAQDQDLAFGELERGLRAAR